MSFLDEDKYNSERLLAIKYIKERIERATTVQNILAPITPQDEYIFDVVRVDDNASEISELSDPFAELGENIILSAESKQRRRLSKVEADVLVMNSFPPTHMEIQNELVSEMRLSQPLHLDVSRIMAQKPDNDKDDEESAVQQVASALSQIGLKGYKEEKRKTDEKDKQRQKQRPKKTKTQEELDFEANSMLSGIWRMLGKIIFVINFFDDLNACSFLDATSMENDGFPITQQGYNFYDDKKKLVDAAESSWDQKEEVRKKCEDWLKNVK